MFNASGVCAYPWLVKQDTEQLMHFLWYERQGAGFDTIVEEPEIDIIVFPDESKFSKVAPLFPTKSAQKRGGLVQLVCACLHMPACECACPQALVLTFDVPLLNLILIVDAFLSLLWLHGHCNSPTKTLSWCMFHPIHNE
jgi:hypothetical protein